MAQQEEPDLPAPRDPGASGPLAGTGARTAGQPRTGSDDPADRGLAGQADQGPRRGPARGILLAVAAGTVLWAAAIALLARLL